MSKELCEIIGYLRENYNDDYNEVLGTIKRVYDKIKEDGKRCFDESDYDKAKELIEWSKKFEMIDFSGIISTKFQDTEIISSQTTINNSQKLFDGIELSLFDIWKGNQRIPKWLTQALMMRSHLL